MLKMTAALISAHVSRKVSIFCHYSSISRSAVLQQADAQPGSILLYSAIAAFLAKTLPVFSVEKHEPSSPPTVHDMMADAD